MTSKKHSLISSVNEKGELTKLLQRLLQIPSDNPPGDTTAIAEFIKEYMSEYGIESWIITTKPGIANIVATVGKGEPHLVLNGHLDTFPAEVGEPWSIPPYSGGLKDGRIYGRGAGDMKGGLAAGKAWQSGDYLNAPLQFAKPFAKLGISSLTKGGVGIAWAAAAGLRSDPPWNGPEDRLFRSDAGGSG